jgi:hypothetical protein
MHTEEALIKSEPVDQEKNIDLSLKIAPDEEWTKWLKNESWPVPTWLVTEYSTVEFRDYNSFLEYNLRTRYMDLEGDFRVLFNNYYNTRDFDIVTAERIISMLQTSRKALEGKEVNLLMTANSLDIIDRYMIWLCPLHIVQKKVEVLANKLIKVKPLYAALLSNTLQSCDGKPDIGSLRAVYDEVTGEINRETTKIHINYGLQIERLQLLRACSFAALFLTILISPQLLNYSNATIAAYKEATLTSVTNNAQLAYFLKGWMFIGILAIFGALGGFISGLLQIKGSTTDLQRYKESLLIFQLKPLVGAVTAAFLAIFISWDLLPGVKIEGVGSFIIIAFLTGFSERYFIKLLNIKQQSNDAQLVEKTNEMHKSGTVEPDPGKV